MSKVVRPQGSFANLTTLGSFIAAEGRISGSGWGGAKSWATHTGLYDPKKKELTELGRRYRDIGTHDVLTLHVMMLNVLHPDAKDEIRSEIMRRGMRLDGDALGMFVGYALTKYREQIFVSQTVNLDNAARFLSTVSGLSSSDIERGLEQVAQRGYVELWLSGSLHQITCPPEHLQPDDWLATRTHDFSDMGIGRSSGPAEAAEEKAQEVRDEITERKAQRRRLRALIESGLGDSLEARELEVALGLRTELRPEPAPAFDPGPIVTGQPRLPASRPRAPKVSRGGGRGPKLTLVVRQRLKVTQDAQKQADKARRQQERQERAAQKEAERQAKLAALHEQEAAEAALAEEIERNLLSRREALSRRAEAEKQAALRWPTPPSGKRGGLKETEFKVDGASGDVYDRARDSLKQERQDAGKRASYSKRDDEAVRAGIEEGKAQLREIAAGVAQWAEARYHELAPGSVMKRDPIRVEFSEAGSSFTFTVLGGPEAQKWARMLEDGVNTQVDPLLVARLSKKRKAVQIYRAKRTKSGKLVRRGGKEGEPGYYLTVPYVFGKGIRRQDGRIDLTEVFERKTYNASGALRSVRLNQRDMASVAKYAMEYDGKDPGRGNELDFDPDGAYSSGRGFERQRAYNERGTSRWRMDGPVDMATDGVAPGRVITRDAANDRLVVSEYGRYRSNPDAPLRRGAGGRAMATRWIRGEDGVYAREQYALDDDDPRQAEYESKTSAKLTRKAGGRLQFRPHAGGQGDILRFRRISTRGESPPNPVPVKIERAEIQAKVKQLFRQAATEAADALRTLGTGRKNGLTIKEKATLQVLSSAS